MKDIKNEINFIDVIQRLAVIIETNLGEPPFDKQIAYELGLSPTQFSNYKKRNNIPFKKIVDFCDKYEITINWILLGKSSIELIEREEKVYHIRIIEKLNKSCVK